MALDTDELWDIMVDVFNEVQRAEAKHPHQTNLPDGTAARFKTEADAARIVTKRKSINEGGDGTVTWLDILNEEFWEAAAEVDREALIKELVQVSAVCARWVLALRTR